MSKLKELTKTQRYIALLTVVALLIYSIVNAFLVIFAYTKLQKNINELGDLSVNWQKGAIQDIQVAANCSTGYESVFQGRYWPGVDNGCWCGSVSSTVLNNQNITCSPFCSNTCGSKELSVGCSSVTGQNAQLLTGWGRIGSTNQQVCIRRSTETFGNSGNLVAPDGSCPSGYTKCGTTTDYVWCTQQTACPITQITVLTGTSNCGGDTSCVVLDDGVATSNPRVLQFRRGDTVDATPLSEWRLNEYGMCDIVSKDEITPGRRQFPLLKTKISSCNNEGGSRWTTSDTITEDKLFQMNGLTSYIASLNPYTSSGMNNGYYETSKSGTDYDWKMFTRSYLPWKIYCRDRLEDVLDKSKSVKELESAQLALLVIGLISTLILGIILGWMEIQNLRGVDLTCIAGEGEEERAKIKKIKQILGYGFKFLVIPFQIWAIILTGRTKALFNDVAERECSSDDTGELLLYFSDTLSATFRSNISSIAITVASLLFDLLMSLCKKKDKNTTEKVAITPSSAKGNNSESLPLKNHNQSQIHSPEKSSGNPFANNNNINANTSSPYPQQTQPQNQGQQLVINIGQNNNAANNNINTQPMYQNQQPQYGQPQYGQPQAQQQFGSNPFGNQQPQGGQQFGSNPFSNPRM